MIKVKTLSEEKSGIIKYLLLICTVFMAHESVLGQGKTDQLLRHSVMPYNLQTGEFTTEFKEEMRRALQDVRILALGESSHEDGATFEHKTNLVKFLHEKLGFNVLAFEFAFYGHWLINQKLKEGEEVNTTTRYAGWTNSKNAYPVYEYIAETKKTNSPLILAGYDSEKVPGGIPDIRNMIREIKDLNEFHFNKSDSVILDSLIMAVYGRIGNQISKEITYSARNHAISLLDSMAVHLQSKEEDIIEKISNEQYLMYQLTLKSIAMDEKTGFAGAYWNIVRDKHMAERLQWLAEKVYKGEKIILWGATSHFGRNLVSIDRTLPPGSYGWYPYYQMGDWVYEYYGDQYYSLAFTTGSGNVGLILPDDHRYKKYEEIRTIEAPKEGSFEAIAKDLNVQSLFTDIKDVPANSWLNGEFIAYPLGYREDRAPWNQIVDGFYYIHEMYPDTMVTMEDK